MTAAVEFVELMERLDFQNFKVSIKSTNVPNTIASNRLLSEKIPYPLHLGITEAGDEVVGLAEVRRRPGHAARDGIGDTIRISLSTFHAEEEVKVAWEILKALQLRERGPVLIACPTCGRLQFDMDTVVAEIERRLEAYEDPIEVAVLGCAVNASARPRTRTSASPAPRTRAWCSRAQAAAQGAPDQLVEVLFEEIDKYATSKRIEVDDTEAAEGAQWLAAIEAENAGELTPERLAAMEAAATDDETADARAALGHQAREGQARRGRLADGRAPLHPGLARCGSTPSSARRCCSGPRRSIRSSA